MDNAKIEELKRLAEAATPAPWTISKYGHIFSMDNGELKEGVVTNETSQRDREFIAALRNAAPELIAIAERGDLLRRAATEAAEYLEKVASKTARDSVWERCTDLANELRRALAAAAPAAPSQDAASKSQSAPVSAPKAAEQQSDTAAAANAAGLTNRDHEMQIITNHFAMAGVDYTTACKIGAGMYDELRALARPAAADAVALEPAGWVFGNSFWERGNPRITDEVKRLGRPLFDRAPATSAAARYTWAGKGGEYELIGTATWAGESRYQTVAVYRDVPTGALYFREPHDFDKRMELVRPAANGAGGQIAATSPAAIATSADEGEAVNRSGYCDDYGDDDPLALGRYRAQVASAIRGKRGRAAARAAGGA